jgi:hypothetical protein
VVAATAAAAAEEECSMRLRGLQGATNAWGLNLLMHAALIHLCVSVSLQVGNSYDVLYAALCYSCMGP